MLLVALRPYMDRPTRWSSPVLLLTYNSREPNEIIKLWCYMIIL